MSMFITLKNRFVSDPKRFFETYPIKLPGSPNDGGTGNFQGSFFPQTVSIGGRKKTVNMGIEFEPTPVKAAWYETEYGAVELILENTIRTGQVAATTAIPVAAWFEVFFLPWSQGCITMMPISPRTRARFFFTGEMNGCAFLVSGTNMNPLTAHLNVRTPESDLPTNWPYERHIELEQMIKATLRGRNRLNAKILTKWGPHATSATPEGRLIQNGADYTYQLTETEGTAAHLEYDTILRDHNRETDTRHPLGVIRDIRCSVFGIKENTSWEFYYQRMVSVSGMSMESLGKIGRLKKKIFGDKRQRKLEHWYITIPGSRYVKLWP